MEQTGMTMMHPSLPLHPTNMPHPRRGKNNRHGPIHANLQVERMSLSEEAKLLYSQEMAAMPSKTPVSVLQELLARRGITPKYELVQIEGAIHEPIFRYRVCLSNELLATGTGRSKKEAKHAAAKNLLELLVGKLTAEQANQTNGTPGAADINGQELLARRGITPKYELIQMEGAIHEPIFRYRMCLGNELLATGTGHSKKEAKNAAAKNLLELLVGKLTAEQANQTNGTPGAADITNQVVSPFDDKVMGNPIGWLQEMCMSRRWPPPFYEMEHEEGLPHERQFTIACRVLKLREIGTGKSKKLAKRVAAHKMWQALQEMPMEGNNMTGSSFGSDEDLVSKLGNIQGRYAGLKDSKITKLGTQQSHKVSQFHKTLKNSSGNKLSELQTIALNAKDFNFVQFLQDIATEQSFEVTYVDIEEKTLSGRCHCLVQLSTLPVAVCFGTGKTPKDAQVSAAHHALEYLKIMTKK